MLTGMLSGAACVVAAALVWNLVRASRKNARDLAAISVVAALVSATALKLVLDPGPEGAVRPIPSDETVRASAAEAPSSRLWSTATGGDASADSIPSLIGGLEQRLEEQPDDVKGWALLAQSYAFIGRPERAEQSLLKAVELGFDEADIRHRVASASRSPHGGATGDRQ